MPRVGASFQPTVDSFVLFQFQDVRTSKTVSGCFSVLFQFFFQDMRPSEIKLKSNCFISVLFHNVRRA